MQGSAELLRLQIFFTADCCDANRIDICHRIWQGILTGHRIARTALSAARLAIHQQAAIAYACLSKPLQQHSLQQQLSSQCSGHSPALAHICAYASPLHAALLMIRVDKGRSLEYEQRVEPDGQCYMQHGKPAHHLQCLQRVLFQMLNSMACLERGPTADSEHPRTRFTQCHMKGEECSHQVMRAQSSH